MDYKALFYFIEGFKSSKELGVHEFDADEARKWIKKIMSRRSKKEHFNQETKDLLEAAIGRKSRGWNVPGDAPTGPAEEAQEFLEGFRGLQEVLESEGSPVVREKGLPRETLKSLAANSRE